MESYIDGIKGLKINGEFRGNDILIPYITHFHIYGKRVTGSPSVYPFTRFYMSQQVGVGTCRTNANTLYANPLLVDFEVTVIGCQMSVSSTTNPASFRFGLYSDNGNCYPDRLIEGTDTGVIDAFAGATQFYFKRKVVLRPGLYWLCRLSNAVVNHGIQSENCAIPVLGSNTTGGQRNANAGFTTSYTFGALPDKHPETYTATYQPIAAQSVVPDISFLTEIPKIKRFNELRMFKRALVNGQDPQRDITINSMLTQMTNDKNILYSNLITGLYGTFTVSANTFRGGWFLVSQKLEFDETFAYNTTSAPGALFGVGIYSMKKVRINLPIDDEYIETYYPDKLIHNVLDLDGSTTGIKSKKHRKVTLSRGIYSLLLSSNASLAYRCANERDYPADQVVYSKTGVTYGSFPSIAPNDFIINPSGNKQTIMLGLRYSI
jgi:hypothetical protein